MRKKHLVIVSAALLAMCLGGCGKKDGKESVAEDFKEVQGTDEDITQAPLSDGTEDYTFTSGNYEVTAHFDTSEINAGVDKIIPAEQVALDDKGILNMANRIFGTGNYEIDNAEQEGSSARNGEAIQVFEFEDYSYESSYIHGNIDGINYQFSYSKGITGYATGQVDMEMIQLDSDMMPVYQYYTEVMPEEEVTNICDEAETTDQALEWMNYFGYEDYELIDVTAARCYTDNLYDEPDGADGYLFTFAREIDHTLPEYFVNNNFYRNGDEFPTQIEEVFMYINSSGLAFVQFPVEYELGEAKDAHLISLDEAMETAKEKLPESFDPEFFQYWGDEARDINIKVSLTYVPVNKQGVVEYTPVYLFVWEDSILYGGNCVQLAISAEDGELINADYSFGIPDLSHAVG